MEVSLKVNGAGHYVLSAASFKKKGRALKDKRADAVWLAVFVGYGCEESKFGRWRNAFPANGGRIAPI